jgi:arginine N-succinyltransferase
MKPMTFRVRAARPTDLEAMYEMAKLGGSGFTNLPADRASLRAKLERAAAAFAEPRERPPDGPGGELFVMVLENVASGDLRGTAQIFACVGRSGPFYSYRLTTLTQHSKELDRTFRAEMLHLVTDLEGSSEVGGLFLHPGERAGGLGLLLARSRYLFIAMHRARFGPRILAELRGVIDERGGSAFWDAVGGKFFGMGFQDADHFNALNGHQCIADLMPKHPVYVAMLPESARTVIGMPHPNGRPAMRMLEAEGFAYEGYVDIFDGGPTLSARTDQVRSIAGARTAPLAQVAAPEGHGPTRQALVATGRLAEFRCTLGDVTDGPDGLVLDSVAAAALDVRPGDTVWHVDR